MNRNVAGSEDVDGIKVAQDGVRSWHFIKTDCTFQVLKDSDVFVCVRYYQFPKKVCSLFGQLVVAGKQVLSVFNKFYSLPNNSAFILFDI